MDNLKEKPILSYDEQIEHLKAKEEDKSKYEKLIGKAEAELQKSKHRFKTEYKERLKKYEKIFYLLHTVRNARNAAAHNNCFLNNLKEQESRSNNINHKVTNALSSIKIKQNQRNKLKNEKINQIITCLYMYKEIVTSKYCEDYKFLKKPYKDVPYELKCQLQEFNKKLEQFNKNIPKEMEYKFNFIQSTFHMIKHVIDHWYLDEVDSRRDRRSLLK